MTNPSTKTSLGTFAFIAGLGAIFMGGAPYAEYFVYHKLVVPGDAAGTAINIIANEALFISGIFGYLITFITDVVVAWALFVFLKPVNENLSLLTAWFRLVYTVISLVALINLVTVLRLLNKADSFPVSEPGQMYSQVVISINAFRNGWSLGYFFFSIHLGLLGYLVIRSNYIPRIIGVLLIMAGLGWLTNTLQPFLFPNLNLGFIVITFFGELIFMFWLLIKGSKIQESNQVIK